MKKIINASLIFSLVGLMSYSTATRADFNSDAELVFNAAEASFAKYFPSSQTTQQASPYLYRYYPFTNIYLGISSSDNGVYVVGGEFGNTPVFVGTIPAVKNLLGIIDQNTTTCDTSSTPAGMTYSQNGSEVTVSTNGQCLKVTNNTLCKPKSSSATNVSVLSTVNNTSSNLKGIAAIIPGLDMQTLLGQSANVSACIINAPAGYSNLTVKYDVCYDMTDTITATTAAYSQFITVTPPVTLSTAGTVNNQAVADCFATNASVVTDVFNNKTWLKVNNQFVLQ